MKPEIMIPLVSPPRRALERLRAQVEDVIAEVRGARIPQECAFDPPSAP